MVQEDVAGRDHLEDTTRDLPIRTGSPGVNGGYFRSGSTDQIRQRHQPVQVHGTVDAEHHLLGEPELAHQVVHHLAGAVVRDLEAHFIAVAP